MKDAPTSSPGSPDAEQHDAESGGGAIQDDESRNGERRDGKPHDSGLRRWSRKRLIALSVLLLLATMGGRLGGFWWRFDLLSHFALQYLLAALVLVAACLWARSRYGLAIAAMSLLINGWLIAPLYLAPDVPEAATSGGPQQELRVCSFNVQGANTNYDATMRYLQQAPCDLLFVLEVRSQWLAALQTLSPHYRIEIAEPRPDNFGIALLSREHRTQSQLVRPTEESISFIETRVTVAGRVWNILGAHPVPPVAAHVAAERDRALDFIADWAARQQGPAVVLGDLNLTPYSVLFARLLQRGKLVNSQRGFGIQPTWPDQPLFLAPGRIPIDHALHNAGVVTRARTVGEAMGSDHRPIFLTFTAASP